MATRAPTPVTAVEQLALIRQAWDAERRASAEDARTRRLERTLRERVAAGDALTDLRVLDEEPAGPDRVRLWVTSGKDSVARFSGSAGEPVWLWWQQPDEQGGIRAMLQRRTGDRLALLVSADDAPALETPGFRLDLLENTITFTRGFEALDGWSKALDAAQQRLIRTALGELPPVPRLAAEPAWFDPHLNAPQQEAIRFVLGTEPVALLHGPPGTGKTRALVEVVRQLTRDGRRIFVTAPSNAAVDNLVERLMLVGVSVVRIGNAARISPAVESASLEARLQTSPLWELIRQWTRQARAIRRDIATRSERGTLSRDERRELSTEASRLQRDARDQQANLERAVLDGAQVIAGTAGGFDPRMLAGLNFAATVVDEATQCLDPLLLWAMRRAPRVILAGDPCQLPPTVTSRDRTAQRLASTVFDRLHAAWGEQMCRMLRVQHRMHGDIMQFPSEASYGGALVADPAVVRAGVGDLGWTPDPERDSALIFVDTAGKGWHDEDAHGSRQNPEQARRVVAEVVRLRSRGALAAQITVLTPYRAQRLLLETLLEAAAPGVEVSTIDGYQGRENEAIVFDLVRSNDEQQVGFLADTRRMNVALTRARRLLLVVGDSATLSSLPYFQAFLDAVPLVGLWKSAWDDEAEPFEN